MPKTENWLNEELKRLENKGWNEFADKLRSNKTKSVDAIHLFFENLGQEARQTHVASKIMLKYVREGKISKEEEKELRTQVFDILKAVGLGVPFVFIPGSTLLMPFLIKLAKKKGIHLLPTAFDGSKNNALNDKSESKN
jgi:hypothetical protein